MSARSGRGEGPSGARGLRGSVDTERRRALALGAALVGALVVPAARGANAAPSTGQPQSDVSASEPDAELARRFDAFLDAAYLRLLVANPQLATGQGESVGADRWESLSETGAAAEAASASRELATLRREFVPERLDARRRLQYRVYERQQELLLERHRWRDHLYPLNQIVGPHVDVPRVLAGQPVRTRAEAEAVVRRLAAVRPYFAGLVERLERQAARGVWLPKSVYPLLLTQSRGLVDAVPNPVLVEFARKLGEARLSPRERRELETLAARAFERDVVPAYRELIRVLEAHAARRPVDGGAWRLPDGDAFYAFLVRQFTTTDLAPESIHALGLREVERVHAEMEEVMRRVGHAGDLASFMQRLKTEPRFFLGDDEAGREAYLARARELVRGMQARLPRAFASPPPLPLEIRATEPYRAAGAPAGFYEAGTPDGSRPGTVWLNLTQLHTRPLYDLEWLLYHEAVPGHHLQISSILVDARIPRVRKVNRWWQDTAFVEGWALYAERLAKELGGYEDPYADFGRLSGELWRATRLVVDSGLHWKRWTREQAIRWLDEHTPSPRAANEAAVDRYLAVPGQATAFTVGMLQILEERAHAEAVLGPRFDLREFHAAVLENGYVPLWALSEHLRRWVDARRREHGAA